MASPAGNGDGESSIGELFGRLADDGRAYVKAEAELYKNIVRRRADRAKYGIVAIIVGALLCEAALITLLVSVARALTVYVGPLLAGLIVAAAAVVLAYALIRFGLARVAALSGDAEEKAALAAGETDK